MRKAANKKRRGNSRRRPDPPEGAEFTSRYRTRSAARRAKAGRCAQARARQGILRSSSGKTKTAARPTRCPLPTKISKTTPCKVAWWSLAWMLWATPRKHFDTSGKSLALFHHRAICKTAHGPAHRALGAITGQKSRQLKLHRNFGASALNPSGSAIARSSTAFRCERLRVD